MHIRELTNRPFWSSIIASFVLALFSAPTVAANPLAKNQGESWTGSYSNPWGMQLTLGAEDDGTYTGELSVDAEAGKQVFSVVLRKSQSSGLQGEFKSGADAFPLSVEHGEEPNQIVITSEGNVYELEKAVSKTANPLAQTTPAKPASAAAAGTTRFRHPDGYFTLDVPSHWESMVHAPDLIQFATGRDDQVVLVLVGELEPHEIGKPLPQVVPGALEVVDELLAGLGVEPDSSRADTETIEVGPLPGAVSRRPATDGINQFTVWQGTVVKGGSAVLVVATAGKGAQPALFANMESAFTSVRMQKAPDHRAMANARNILFNGERMSDKKLTMIEGASTGLIPDGEYWYDAKTGMVGQVGGPTLAYLAAELNFCPPVAADASGGATSVAINGRYLHPEDLAGLEYYFGPIQPNRYWMDSMGNYGLEGGPLLGNLLQQIAAIQQMAAAAQAGAAGGAAQGGYNDAYYGGGSVYSHFPNLGAGGTGVGVADLGGGDTIVNAGGVMWWPGK